MKLRYERMTQHSFSTAFLLIFLSVLLISVGCSGSGTTSDQETLNEDCIPIEPSDVTVRQVEGSWKIMEGDHWIDDFDSKEQKARKAHNIIQHYKLDKYCYVGRPNPPFTYFLSGRNAPSGSIPRENCSSFNPNNLQVKKVDGSWKIVAGGNGIYDFGSNEAEASKALKIIKKYGFRNKCYVGQPDPSFIYLK